MHLRCELQHPRRQEREYSINPIAKFFEGKNIVNQYGEKEVSRKGEITDISLFTPARNTSPARECINRKVTQIYSSRIFRGLQESLN